MNTLKDSGKTKGAKLWFLIWSLGLAGQICWNIENQWFNTFVYAKIGKDPSVITGMLIASAAATTFSTFFFGTWSDRTGKRRHFISLGYILWGVFTIVFGLTQFISPGIITFPEASTVLSALSSGSRAPTQQIFPPSTPTKHTASDMCATTSR